MSKYILTFNDGVVRGNVEELSKKLKDMLRCDELFDIGSVKLYEDEFCDEDEIVTIINSYDELINALIDNVGVVLYSNRCELFEMGDDYVEFEIDFAD